MDIKDFVNVRTIESVTNYLVSRIIKRRKMLKISKKRIVNPQWSVLCFQSEIWKYWEKFFSVLTINLKFT